MKKYPPFSMISGAILLPLLFQMPAGAQATRTWVSGVGDDVNPCSRTAPCKTFAGAISKTAAGGEIDTLDPGGFGGVTITKAITIASEGTGEAGVLVAGTNGIIVNAGPTDTVILRGLQIDGGPNGSNSLAGVKFIAGGALIVQNCAIRNFTGAAPNGYGISFTPSTAASLFVTDTVVSNNGQVGASTGGGIFIAPSGSGIVKAILTRVRALNNAAFGIRAEGTSSIGSISVAISDSTVAGNGGSAIKAVTPGGGAVTKMEVTHTSSINNGTGLDANGVAATLRVGYSTITGNTIGVQITNSATMTSMGNNLITDNATSGPAVAITGAN